MPPRGCCGELPVQCLVLALQHGGGLGAGLVFLPHLLDAGPQRFQVCLCREGVLQPLLEPGELLGGHCRRHLVPGTVVLSDAAQGLKLPGHALVRVFPALRQL